MPYLLAALLATITSWLIVWGVRWYSRRGMLLDIPNERSSHNRPTPRGGGIAIVIVTVMAMGWSFGGNPTVLAYIGASLLIAVVSWVDDVRSLSNRVRFGTHLLGAGIVVAMGGSVELITLPLIGTLSLGWLGIPLTLFWLVGMTNIYNFMDGIDGIAGGQAVVAGVGWFGLGMIANQPIVMWLGLVVAAASVGFSIHNWSPAKIFMGDVGSAFLGFTFGWVGIMATHSNPNFALPMILLLWTFLFDGGFTLLRRWRRGENIFTAHRSHLYQRMVIRGKSHAYVSTLYILLAVVGGGAAWLSWQGYGVVGLAIVGCLAVGLWGLTRRLEQS